MNKNKILFEKSEDFIPGGVNSPVRAFGSVGGTPIFFKRGKGSRLIDENDKEYIDYINSWGPMILGHAHPEIIQSVKSTADYSLSFGAPTSRELSMAELIVKLVPSIEQVRLVSSGTEATMSAIRVARGFTKRDEILKFEGCYHGHADSLLVKAGSGALTFGQPSSAGVPADTAKHTHTLEYNNVQALEECFENMGQALACVIIEPVVGNMNLIVPKKEFLKRLRELCTEYDVVLIFDEVMTGFRVALGGAQSLYDVIPDMTTLGKVIGGGLPVGAFGGRKEIMQQLAPLGPVYQAGTLSGNPVAVSAGMKTLELIQQPNFFENLSRTTKSLVDGLIDAAKASNIEFSAQSVGGMFGFYFSSQPPESFDDVMLSDREKFNKFFHLMLEQGIYFGPSAFEAGFVSSAHTDDDINQTIQAAMTSFKKLK
ncbi:MAG: glutamate-1-semialdehyde 2,1-aminomutase [Nitrosomonadales bacterium]|jgi:glutamate-1-semialdehyde 2,1-aminomutase|nr:glutamate-1-semialdehyde 2,1-aminomutase [Nitrosomonadales bacterium]|tara:strand:+ start:516 stop:1796 length:1281 start_codon:yes stop_codon:yes gene_type:complete